MSSESSSTISTPEIVSYIFCYICKIKIKRENFDNHYNSCKCDYLKSEKSKYYPLKEPNNMDELIDIILNSNNSITLNEINQKFISLHNEMKLLYCEESKRSMTPNEYFQAHKQRVLKRHSFNPEQIKIKHLFSIKKIKSTSLELKKVTKDEVEDMKKFSIILN
jgi:hypothetical protein